MPLKSIVLIGFALVMAVVTALLARGLMSDGPAPATVAEAPAPKSLKILVAAGNLSPGRILNAQDLSWQSWPDDRLHDSYLVEGKYESAQMVGNVVRFPIRAGEPLNAAGTVARGERGFLAAALQPGMLAVTVGITQVTGISGFIFPGDRVDLILNHEIEVSDKESRLASETVVRNARVLAVDTRTEVQGTGPDAPQPQLGKTVTLEVTPKIAEKIALIERLGNLTLALRSLATEGDAAEAGDDSFSLAAVPPSDGSATFTWDAEVSSLLPPVNQEADKVEVKLSRGADSSVIEFPKDR